MNTLQLKDYLCCHLPHICTEVLALDELQTLQLSYPAALIVNTEPSTKPGEHWVAVYLTCGGKGYYMDTRGAAPCATLRKFLRRVAPGGSVYNSQRLQSIFTDLCGAYCVDFLYHRHVIPYMSYARLLAHLYPYRDPWKNDVVVHRRFEIIFKTRLAVKRVKRLT